VVPIVAQSPDAVRRYIEETGLPFDILIDETREVAKAYGVWHAWGLDAYNIARPAVFLIDRAATIRYEFVSSRQDQYPSPDEIHRAIGDLG
jgi:methyl-accepting chemotaxis protein